MVTDVDQIFKSLCVPNSPTQKHAMRELHDYVISRGSLARSTSTDEWQEGVGRNLVTLVNSRTVAQMRGAILAIEVILEIIKEDPLDNRRNLFRFYNHLATMLREARDTSILDGASRSLGRLAQISGTVLGDRFVEEQIPLFLEMGSSDRISPFGAVLALKELARHSSQAFQPNISNTFNSVLSFLRNEQANVRHAAAQLLRYLLSAMGTREFQSNQTMTTNLFVQVVHGLETNSVAILHGSLLAMHELFLYADKELLMDRFLEVCEAVLRYRIHGDNAVRTAVIEMIPVLSRYDRQVFCDQFFNKTMSYLIERLDSPDGPKAYLAIGHLSIALKTELFPFIDPIFQHVKNVLKLHTRRSTVLLDKVFEAIGLIARSMGPAITNVVNDHLELVFACKLSESLVRMLGTIVRYISALLGVIQERLLDLVSVVLSGRHYYTQGSPKPSVEAISPFIHHATNQQITLALKVLGDFNFKGHLLNEFIANAVIPHLDDEEEDTRKAAAIATCRLLCRDPIRFQRSRHAMDVLTTILDKLLSVAIVDSNAHVRQTVLGALDMTLDFQLARAEYVRLLMIALHDEVVDNRILAVKVIGRLVVHNPGEVLPPLRKTLIRLLSDLKCAVTSQSKEDAIRILAALLKSTHAVVEHHIIEVLPVLLDLGDDSNPVVITEVLFCLGQLTAVDTTNIVSGQIPRIMNIILSALRNSHLRSPGLDCLGQLCTNIQYVVTPLGEYPQLRPLLHGMLKREQSHNVRLQVVRVIGLLGALDPVRYQVRMHAGVLMESPPESINVIQETEEKRSTIAPDDPHQERVVELLLTILQKKSLGSHHHLIIDALVTIAKARGNKFAATAPAIIPIFCSIVRDAAPSVQDYYLGQLTFLIGAIRQHIRSCVNHIITLVHDIWDTVSQRLALVVLVESLADALASEFSPFVSALIPRMLTILQEDKTDLLFPTQVKTVRALTAFASNLQNYTNLVVPVVISCYEHNGTPQGLRTQAIQSLKELSHTVDLYPYTSRIIHSLIPLVTEGDELLHQTVVDAIHTFIYTLRPGVTIFVPILVKTFNNSSTSQSLCEAFAKVLVGDSLPPLERTSNLVEAPPAMSNRSPNPCLLQRAWDTSRVSDSHDAWIAWFTNLAAQFAKESPSLSLRSCMNLFDIYPDISTQLFNPALASCWRELTESFQEDFIQSIQHVMSSSSVPPEIGHYMLDLVEYMERTETPLAVPNGSMADYCFRLQAYAKALHYRELQFFQDFAPSTIEALIDTNAMLRQGDAALGILNLARQHYDVLNLGSWYEKLGQWNDALPLYEEKEDICDPLIVENDIYFIGKLRCLHALGEWDRVTVITGQKWSHSNRHLQSLLAPLGAAGAWHTSAWSPLETYYQAMEENSGDRAFYSAVTSTQRNRLSHAISDIWTARELLDPQLTSLLDESPDRLDRFSVQAQMLSELEEVILYKQLADHPERRQKLRETWKRRLDGCQRDMNVWQRILRVRSLAIKPEEDIDTYVRFANLCRKAGRLGTAQRTLDTLIEVEADKFMAAPQIVYAQLKLQWARGNRTGALSSLHEYIQKLSQDKRDNLTEAKAVNHILARCYLKHGTWKTVIDGGLSSANAESVINSYNLAKNLDPKWPRAWHTWALLNVEIIRITPVSNVSELATRHTCHIVAAIEGFFHSLGLMGQNTLQDALSLLTLWFKFGAQSAVTLAMVKGFKGVNCNLWLDVVPQIIARIQTPVPIIREALMSLLVDIGREHPQALVYPLTVGAKSPSHPRKEAATKILRKISSHSGKLVEQAMLVARELSRVAVSWGELWCEVLRASGRHFFNSDSKTFLENLQPLYDLLEDPCTPFELRFKVTLGPTLEEARALCRRHITNGDKGSFEKGWHMFLRVYHQIDAHLPDIQAPARQGTSKSLDLHSVSPQLLHAVPIELAVPGTYSSGSPIIRIASFKQRVPVIPTKQRPRQLTITGENGQRFLYLLKGREDLRQDERVMQVFGLVNTLLVKDRECLNRRLHLQRYTVIPLAPDVGLIGWMAGTDTLQNLIVDYRKSHKILPDLEYRMILQEEPEYETDDPSLKIPPARRLQVFESVMNRTTGQDLYRILWLKSDSSEAWVSRRTTYTRTLAVSNMVCYLLGVGDRHPGNILLGRTSGKVIHIDFGDCFEVSFERDTLPEKVPFRLTRMMRHAMEVCGIQGGFKTSCEISMTVLRDHRESLMAVLEALVHDPLINWRLVQAESEAPKEVAGSLGSTDGVPNRRTVLDETVMLDASAAPGADPEVRNGRALAVCSRVEAKLTGRDFDHDQPLSVPAQVNRLIEEATSNENLCQHFQGWCPFW